MKYILETTFNEEELNFIDKYKCEILSEIKLSKTNFTENEIPRRIIKPKMNVKSRTTRITKI